MGCICCFLVSITFINNFLVHVAYIFVPVLAIVHPFGVALLQLLPVLSKIAQQFGLGNISILTLWSARKVITKNGLSEM